MKKTLAVVLSTLSFNVFSAAYDMGMDQRNPTNSGWITRLIANPPTNGLLMYNTSTTLPEWVTFGSNLTLTGSVLNSKDQVQVNWNATTGVSSILNKPTLFSGAYSDLTGKPILFSGNYNDLTNKPIIPAAQVNTDWASSSGVSQLLNKPTTIAGYGITDGVTSLSLATTLTSYATNASVNAGLLTKFNNPSGNSGQYVRGDGSLATFPSIPVAQVNSDWSASSGVAQILNKPVLGTAASQNSTAFATSAQGVKADTAVQPASLSLVATSGSYLDLTNRPTIPSAQVNSDWNSVSGVSQVLNKPTLGTSAALNVATTGDASSSQVVKGDDTRLTNNRSTTSLLITDATAVGRGVLTATSQANARASIGAGTSNFDGVYSSLTGIPSAFVPSAHTHVASDIVSGTLDVARIPDLAISKITSLQTTLNGKFNNPSGTTTQYVRGDGSLATLPTVVTVGNPSSRTVALATAYQCTNTARPCIITITLQSQSAISLSGSSNNEGNVMLGSTSAVATGTGTAIGTYKNVLGGGLVVGLNLNSLQANTYTVNVPIGYYFAVIQTSGTGLQITSAFEQSN